MKNFLKTLAVIALMAVAGNAWASGAIVAHKSGDIFSTNKSSAGISAADAFIVPTGFGWLGPGTEGLVLPAYRPGVCWFWYRYDGFRVVGTPFEAWPGGVRTFRADSTGIEVTGKATISDSLGVVGRAVLWDSLRVEGPSVFQGKAVADDSLTVHGRAMFGDSLRVEGAALLQGKAVVDDSLTVHGRGAFGDTLRSDRVLRTSGWVSTPRIGPASGPTTGGALRIVDGVTFPLTLAGLQAAADECEAAGGGELYAPSNMNITLSTTPFKIPNRVRVIFTGTTTSLPTFTASASTNVVAAVMPKDTTGVQQTLWVEGLQVAGNLGSGGWIGAGLLLKGVYVGSQVRRALIRSCSGYGLKIDGGSVGVGQLWLEDIIAASNGDDNILVTGNADHIIGAQITSESPSTGNACIRLELGAGASANANGQFFGVHMEGNNVADGIVLDRVSGWILDGVVLDGGASFNSVVKITGTTTGSDGAFGAAGNVIRNLRGVPTGGVLIDDQSAAVQITTSQGRFVDFYRSPLAPDDRITGQYVGAQPARLRAAITSAATLVLPKGGWSDADVSGTTAVTAITGNATFLWQTLCFWTSAALQFTDGGNINLNGNFVGNGTGGKDCLCGKWDGTNFNEVSRSLN